MAELPPAPDELPPAPDEVEQVVLPPAPDEISGAVIPPPPDEEPGFLKRQFTGAQRKWQSLDDPSLQAWAHDVSGITPEAIGDRSTPEQQEAYRHWNLARVSGLRGMMAADEAGAAGEFGRSGGQAAIGVRSIPGTLARLALRGASAIGGEDSMAGEAYNETLGDFYTQKAFDEQAKFAGTIGQVAGAIADPLSLAGGMGIGKGLQAASAASPVAAKVFGAAGQVASEGGLLRPAAGTMVGQWGAGANIAQQAARAGVEGAVTGAATGALEATAGGQDLERAALAGASGAVGGTLLGSAAPALGAGVGKAAGTAAKSSVMAPTMTYLRHLGTSVQERLRPVEGGIDLLQFLDGKMPVRQKLSELHGTLDATPIDQGLKDLVKGGKFKQMDAIEKAKVLDALPPKDRLIAAATFTHHANVVDGVEQLKSKEIELRNALQRFNPDAEADASGRLNFTQIREMVGPDNFNKLRLEELDTNRGISTAIKTAEAFPDSPAKTALLEGLNYKKGVYTEGQKIANSFGLENAHIEGYSHRFRNDGVNEAAELNIQENPDRLTSQSGQARSVDVTLENLDKYNIEGEVKNYVDNFEANHMSGKNGMNGIVSVSNKLPGDLEKMKKAVELERTSSVKGLREGAEARSNALKDIGASMDKAIEDLRVRQAAEMDAARKAQVIPAMEADAADQAAQEAAAGFGSNAIPKAGELRAAQAAELEGLAQRHAEELRTAQESYAKAYSDMVDANAKAEVDDASKYAENLKAHEAADKQITDMMAEIAQGQTSNLKGRMSIKDPSKGLAGVKNLFAAYLSHSSLSDQERRYVQAAANAHFERTMNPHANSDLGDMAQRTMHLLNAVNPGVVASILLDPLSIMVSGNTDTMAKALAENIKVPGAKQVIEASKDAIFTPIKAIGEASNGDWRKGGKMAYDYITNVSQELHKLMDSVNVNSSVRDIVGSKSNALKFRKAFGDQAYARAVEQGKNWISTKGEIPKGSELFRLAKLVSNEKLPTDTMAQTVAYNKLTRGELGRFLTQNASFTANRLNNTIRVANELIQKADTPGIRQHAIISAAQLTVLGLLIEKMFFDKVYEFSSNDVNPQHRKETAMTAVNDLTGVSRLLRAPPLIGKALQVVNDFSKPESFITRNPGKFVPTPASHVTGFIPAAARTLKAGEKLVNGWVKQP